MAIFILIFLVNLRTPKYRQIIQRLASRISVNGSLSSGTSVNGSLSSGSSVKRSFSADQSSLLDLKFALNNWRHQLNKIISGSRTKTQDKEVKCNKLHVKNNYYYNNNNYVLVIIKSIVENSQTLLPCERVRANCLTI